MPKRELGGADVTFDVKNGNAKIGTVAGSKGSVIWFPKDCSYGYKANWSDLNRLLIENGTKSKKR